MEPIAVWVRKNGEWAIIHRCKVCGALSSNRIERMIIPDLHGYEAGFVCFGGGD